MKLIWIAWLSCCLLSSCQSGLSPNLKSNIEISSARRIAISQSEDLDRATLHGSDGVASFLVGRSKEIALPKNYTAKAVASALPNGITANMIPTLIQPLVSGNRVFQSSSSPDYASAYDSISPMKGNDVIVQICPAIKITSSGGGYYNPAASMYVPMGGRPTIKPGGYIGHYDPFFRSTSNKSVLDIYVYRGSDGRCLGSFYLSLPSANREQDVSVSFKKHVDKTASLIVYRIFGAEK